MGKGVWLVSVLVIGSIKILYHLRFIPIVESYLSTFVAILLIYPCALHVWVGRSAVRFFERGPAEVFRSVRLFVGTALVIFPLFTLVNHVYQTQLFGLAFSEGGLHLDLQQVATQLLLVAFPEEFFFRGYLQTSLSRRFHRPFHFLGLPFVKMTTAVPIASLLFAASHSLITFQWWHFAIFFPSLAFGWLRERTHGLIAPILFHATSNVLVHLIGQAYR